MCYPSCMLYIIFSPLCMLCIMSCPSCILWIMSLCPVYCAALYRAALDLFPTSFHVSLFFAWSFLERENYFNKKTLKLLFLHFNFLKIFLLLWMSSTCMHLIFLNHSTLLHTCIISGNTCMHPIFLDHSTLLHIGIIQGNKTTLWLPLSMATELDLAIAQTIRSPCSS